MGDLHCHRCQVPLTGGLDTFGDIHMPVCEACHRASHDDFMRVMIDSDDELRTQLEAHRDDALTELEYWRDELRDIEDRLWELERSKKPAPAPVVGDIQTRLLFEELAP